MALSDSVPHRAGIGAPATGDLTSDTCVIDEKEFYVRASRITIERAIALVQPFLERIDRG